MEKRKISEEEALALIVRDESHLWDQKSARSGGTVVEKIAVALANSDGGEFILGIEDARSGSGILRWSGFASIEEANFIHQALAGDIHPPVPYSYENLEIEGRGSQGIACLVRVEKSVDVHFTSGKKCLVRRGASSREISGQAITDLQLSKGTKSYEDQQLADYDVVELADEPELHFFLKSYSPRADVEGFTRRERIVDRASGQCRVAAAVLFSEYPSSVVPKRCAVKIARYNTAGAPRREHLNSPPMTIEGPARKVIERTLEEAAKIIQSVSVLQLDGSLEPMKYPPEALKEIVVNAIIHRDYNISDDVHVSIFDNRVEVKSPGGLPGQMTLELLFKERASRNPKILRLLNRYENPPNQDIGEGLKTAREKMTEAKLREPKFSVEGNYFLAVLPHERLARPEELVMEYLASNIEITNKIARELTGIRSENTMKEVFYSLRDVKKIERVPGKNGNLAAWRLV
ncbi:ATP-binding protein [Arthrobacter koreensis]|uniref:ATP-binding protein n=1 Tax=Arthrobacter koreensis TaxID=199136 RepID=UPI0036D87C8B